MSGKKVQQHIPGRFPEKIVSKQCLAFPPRVDEAPRERPRSSFRVMNGAAHNSPRARKLIQPLLATTRWS